MKTILAALSTSLLIGSSSVVFADTAMKSAEKPADKAAITSSMDKKVMTDGEIKKVDKETGKVTIKHGEIKNLDMPSMTMVFRVKDSTMLDKLKAGDKVNFSADKINGNITVTEIEAAK